MNIHVKVESTTAFTTSINIFMKQHAPLIKKGKLSAGKDRQSSQWLHVYLEKVV